MKQKRLTIRKVDQYYLGKLLVATLLLMFAIVFFWKIVSTSLFSTTTKRMDSAYPSTEKNSVLTIGAAACTANLNVEQLKPSSPCSRNNNSSGLIKAKQNNDSFVLAPSARDNYPFNDIMDSTISALNKDSRQLIYLTNTPLKPSFLKLLPYDIAQELTNDIVDEKVKKLLSLEDQHVVTIKTDEDLLADGMFFLSDKVKSVDCSTGPISISGIRG